MGFCPVVIMVFLLTGGGSAGHVNPALAMAELLSAHFTDAEIYFMGKKNGIEERLVADAMLPFIPVRAASLRRSLSVENLRAAFLALNEPHRLKKIIRSLSPDLVLGTGGYVSYPVIKAARLAGIPALLHESNAVPGLTVKLCERLVDRILLQFEACASHLRYPERAAVIGAPLRKGFQNTDRLKARKCLSISPSDFFVLSFGGSLGAEALNEAVLNAQRRYAKEDKPVLFIHGCGTRHYEALYAKYPRTSPKMQLLPYINDMPLYMSAADLIISRAGAMTLSEISACGKPTILIPSPYVAADHQRKNALYLQERGAALVLEEATLTGELLYQTVEALRRQPSRLSKMQKAASSLFAYDTKALFLAEVEALLARKSLHPSKKQ